MGKYYGTELVSTYGTTGGNFEFLLLGTSLGYLYELEVGCNEGSELWISGGSFLGTTIGTYNGTEIGLS